MLTRSLSCSIINLLFGWRKTGMMFINVTRTRRLMRWWRSLLIIKQHLMILIGLLKCVCRDVYKNGWITPSVLRWICLRMFRKSWLVNFISRLGRVDVKDVRFIVTVLVLEFWFPIKIKRRMEVRCLPNVRKNWMRKSCVSKIIRRNGLPLLVCMTDVLTRFLLVSLMMKRESCCQKPWPTVRL